MSEVTEIDTAMRRAFRAASITPYTSHKLVIRVVKALRGGVGVMRRRRLWNKEFSDGNRPRRK